MLAQGSACAGQCLCWGCSAAAQEGSRGSLENWEGETVRFRIRESFWRACVAPRPMMYTADGKGSDAQSVL